MTISILEIILPLLLVTIILITILWVLYSQNKKAYYNLSLEKLKLNSYEKRVLDLQNNLSKDQRKDLQKLSKISRDFFKEYYNLNYSLTYLEIASMFKKENLKLCEDYSRILSEKEYSGEDINPKELKDLSSILLQIIKTYYK
jgi:hypothetical protein